MTGLCQIQSSCLNIPDSTVINGVKMPELEHCDEIRTKAYTLCKEYLNGSWREISQKELIIKKVSGGLSNLLYYCALPSTHPPQQNEPPQVLLRIYGQTQGDRVLETHLTECVIFTMLAENQRGPRLYGVFSGGRLEQYIPGRPLVTDELSTFSLYIAESVAEIHSMQVPLLKEPRWLWDTMTRWLNTIDQFIKQGNISGKNQIMVDKIIKYDLAGELKWMKKFLITKNSSVLFCHNDLQEGNILLKNLPQSNQIENILKSKSSRRKLVIIDFEYCAYNYRGFDLANHFCEYMYDYSNEEFPYFWAKHKNYPSVENQKKFVEKYLQILECSLNINDNEIEVLLDEVKSFTLASHMFWGLWSVVNATNSTISFDYWGYGEERFNSYFKHKLSLHDSN